MTVLTQREPLRNRLTAAEETDEIEPANTSLLYQRRGGSSVPPSAAD